MNAPTIEVYRNEAGEWFWRLRSTNSRIMADGAEGYAQKKNCLKAVERVRKAFGVALVELRPTEVPTFIPLVSEFPKYPEMPSPTYGRRIHKMGEE